MSIVPVGVQKADENAIFSHFFFSFDILSGSLPCLVVSVIFGYSAS